MRPERIELEPFCGRERSRGPRHARFSRDGVEEREPAGEIPSGARDLRNVELNGRKMCIRDRVRPGVWGILPQNC